MQHAVGSSHPTVAPAWQSLVDVLQPVLAGYATGGHILSLSLAGALLDLVPAEAVPAIVDAATAAWTAPSPGHYRRNAEDTVSRWARGYSVRRDVPPAIATVLRPTLTAEPLEETTRRLEHAIGDAGEGVTVIRAGCGLGKTRASENAARVRAARDGSHKQNVRTIISVPTNDLACQIAGHLPGCLRIYGPASVQGEHACRFRDAAQALAAGGLSVRWELCEGRRQNPCEHYQDCRARDGAEGPADARIVVGNHGLLHELSDQAGATGLLVLDEPPAVMADVTISAANLACAADMLRDFDDPFATLMAPALDCVRRWLDCAPLAQTCQIEDAFEEPDPYLLEVTCAETVADAVRDALPRRRVPPVRASSVARARHNVAYARQLGEAARVLAALHRAVTDDSWRAAVYQFRGPRYLALTGVRPDLADAIRREGRTVICAADAHLYLEHLRDVLGYEPRYLELPAPDGVAVRRIAIRARRANRTEWIVQRRPPAGLLAQALALATGRVAVVTFQALEPWVRTQAPNAATGHYGALRGLDRWAAHDTLITLGDPIPNLDHVARTTDRDIPERARALGAAELEQAHGRLRTVHRTTPCTQIHVGMLCPDGWRAPIEEHVPTEGGRPRAPSVDVGALVRALGGIRKAARAVHVAPVTVLRWTRGERVPNEEAVAALDAAARGVADLACQGVLPKPPISKLLIGGFGNTQCVMKHGGAS